MFLLIEKKTTGIVNFVNPGLISIPDLITSTNTDLEFKIFTEKDIGVYN